MIRIMVNRAGLNMSRFLIFYLNFSSKPGLLLNKLHLTSDSSHLFCP